jgi:hypothetical protein
MNLPVIGIDVHLGQLAEVGDIDVDAPGLKDVPDAAK